MVLADDRYAISKRYPFRTEAISQIANLRQHRAESCRLGATGSQQHHRHFVWSLRGRTNKSLAEGFRSH